MVLLVYIKSKGSYRFNGPCQQMLKLKLTKSTFGSLNLCEHLHHVFFFTKIPLDPKSTVLSMFCNVSNFNFFLILYIIVWDVQLFKIEVSNFYITNKKLKCNCPCIAAITNLHGIIIHWSIEFFKSASICHSVYVINSKSNS